MSAAGDPEYAGTPSTRSGDRPGEEIYFAYSAALRIFGSIPNLEEITQRLGIIPSETHRKGQRGWGPNLPPYDHDMWSYNAPVNKSEPLHVHIDTLWNTFSEHKSYLLQLKQNLTVDFFLGYTSNSDRAGVVVPHHSLEMFKELQVPFGLSIIVI